MSILTTVLLYALYAVLLAIGAAVASWLVFSVVALALWLVSLPVRLTVPKSGLMRLVKTIQLGLFGAREAAGFVLGWIIVLLLPVLKYGGLLALIAAAGYAIWKAPMILLVFALSWLVTWKLIPWLWVRLERLFGGSGKMTPITKKRVARFRRIKRGYWSFRVITTLFVMSLFLELIVSGKAIAIYYDGNLAFPAPREWVDKLAFFTKISSFEKASDFGQVGDQEVDYRKFAKWCDDPSELDGVKKELEAKLEKNEKRFAKMKPPKPDAPELKRKRYESKQRSIAKTKVDLAELVETRRKFEGGSAWVLMPVYPYGPQDLRTDVEGSFPLKPSLAKGIPLGTDTSGHDVVALLTYGFRISFLFALVVAAIGYAIGIVVGGIQGYYGGWTDIVTQRFQEIWGSIPFLFTIMIIGTMVDRTLGLMIVLMVILRSWLGITYYVRAEFYREKAKDYVQAAIGAGVSDRKIILGHILPNSLVPVVTFAPFGIVAYIGALVSLDFLGFGLPPGTPSWGALLGQGLGDNLTHYPHLTIVPTVALAISLYMVVMIGEAVREAFDPKVFSRLR